MTHNCTHLQLLYLCADPDPLEGLSKALTIAAGVPVNVREVRDSILDTPPPSIPTHIIDPIRDLLTG